MADPREAEPAQRATKVETPETKKKAPRSRKAKAEPKLSVRKNRAKAAARTDEAPTAAVRTGRKIYSEKERAHMLSEIEKSIVRATSGMSSLFAAA